MSKTQRIGLADNADVRVIDENFQTLESMITSTKTVTIPDNTNEDWTEETDSDSNLYYTIEIPVVGMTEDFTGSNATDFVRPNSYNVNEVNALSSLFSLITKIESMNGKIKVYASSIPSDSFDIILYGV